MTVHDVAHLIGIPRRRAREFIKAHCIHTVEGTDIITTRRALEAALVRLDRWSEGRKDHGAGRLLVFGGANEGAK